MRFVTSRACGGEPIAPARNGCDDIAAKRLSNGTDLHGQVVVFDGKVRPDGVQKFCAADDAAASFEQGLQHVERTSAERHGQSVLEHLTPFGLDLESLEAAGFAHGCLQAVGRHA